MRQGDATVISLLGIFLACFVAFFVGGIVVLVLGGLLLLGLVMYLLQPFFDALGPILGVVLRVVLAGIVLTIAYRGFTAARARGMLATLPHRQGARSLRARIGRRNH